MNNQLYESGNNNDDMGFDNDLFEEPSDGPLSRVLLFFLVLAVAIASVVGYLYFNQTAADKADKKPLSIVRADNLPIRTKPTEPGGMPIPDQDKAIYDTLATHKPAMAPKVQKLSPMPEEPVNLNHFFPSAEHPAKAPEEPKEIMEANKIEPKPEAVVVAAVPAAKAESAPKAAMPESKAKDKISKGKLVVQLASFKQEKDAYATWTKISKKYPKLLGQYSPFVVQKDIAGRGLFFRLQAGPFASEAAARLLCKKLIEAGQGCFVTKYAP